MVRIVRPTVAAMKAEGMPYKGVLFAGLMITKDGPQLIEYNVRFGDPECQVILMRLMSDLLPALIASTAGVLASFDLRWYDDAARTVVMAAQGYPGASEKASVLRGLALVGRNPEDAMNVQAAITKREAGAQRATSGPVA